MLNRLKSISDNTITKRIVVFVVALLALISLLQGIRNAIGFSQDFQWDAAKALAEGLDPYEISLKWNQSELPDSLKEFYKVFNDAGVEQKMEANQFPSLLWLLVVFTLMPPLMARYAWLAANLLFTVGIVYLLRKTFLKNLGIYEYVLTVLLMIAGTPYRNQLGVGQHTLFSFFFFLMAVWLDERKPNGNHTGITICMFISYFKYTLTAPLTLYLLYRKRYLEFFASVIMHIILTVVSALYMGKSVIYMITAPLQVAKVLSSEGGLDLGALFGGNSIALVIGGIIAIMLFVLTLMAPSGKEYLVFSVLLLWSLVLTYHRTYDYFVLAGAAVLMTGDFTNDFTDKMRRYTDIAYILLIMAVYFGLRIFSENTVSKIAVGLLYYIFTIFVTALFIICVVRGRKENGRK